MNNKAHTNAPKQGHGGAAVENKIYALMKGSEPVNRKERRALAKAKRKVKR